MSADRPSTGIVGLDDALGGLRIGDNVVWQCSSLADFHLMLDPWVAASDADGRRMIYLRFGSHEPLIAESPRIERHYLDPSEGFEAMVSTVHDLIVDTGPEAFYIFDDLSELVGCWHSDLMAMNFFKVTCPLLFQLDTIAYFPLLRERTTASTLAGIRETTQLLLDLHVVGGEAYVHPLKVDWRSSPTMFFPHRIDGDQARPVTSSDASARLFGRLGRVTQRPDHWALLTEQAVEALDADEATQTAVRNLLFDAMIGAHGQMADLARRHLSLADLLVVASRQVGTGRVGGKAVGMLVARAIVEHHASGAYAPRLEPHDSFYIGTDVFYTYLVANGWWSTRQAQRDPAQFLSAGADLYQQIPSGTFPATIREQMLRMLEYFGQAPIIVRSSSLLEDGYGNAFAGKYESIFLTNQGSPEQRLAALEDAVRTVYASAMSQDALEYRVTRGLADADEQMAVLVQRVSGDHHGSLFYPHVAGVAHSMNLYVSHPDTDPEAGMARMVIGLGTRAVDRITGDHAWLVSLDSPTRGPRLEPGESAAGHCQRYVDVLDLEANEPRTVPLGDLDRADLGTDWSLLASPDREVARLMRDRGRPLTRVPEIPDFSGLLTRTDFAELLRSMLADLEAAYDYPVDVEFTANIVSGDEPRLNIVQCRPLQTRGPGAAVALPDQVDDAAVLFRSEGNFMGGNVRIPLEYVVVVRPAPYLALASADKHEVARAIGRVNAHLEGSKFLLAAPGRWGTTTEALGVPVRFGEISHASALVELTYPEGEFRPELSYGSHFFLDLVEHGIFYAALFDERPGVMVNPDLVARRPELLGDLLGERVGHVIHVARFADLELLSDVASNRVICVSTSSTA